MVDLADFLMIDIYMLHIEDKEEYESVLARVIMDQTNREVCQQIIDVHWKVLNEY